MFDITTPSLLSVSSDSLLHCPSRLVSLVPTPKPSRRVTQAQTLFMSSDSPLCPHTFPPGLYVVSGIFGSVLRTDWTRGPSPATLLLLPPSPRPQNTGVLLYLYRSSTNRSVSQRLRRTHRTCRQCPGPPTSVHSWPRPDPTHTRSTTDPRLPSSHPLPTVRNQGVNGDPGSTGQRFRLKRDPDTRGERDRWEGDPLLSPWEY